MKRSKVLEFSRSLVGTPFVHGQAVPGIGMDCLGFMTCVLDKFKVKYTVPAKYRMFPLEKMIPIMDEQFKVESKYLTGTMVLMNYTERNELGHLGIIGENSLIHAYDRAGQVCESPWGDFFIKRVVKMYKIPRITN